MTVNMVESVVKDEDVTNVSLFPMLGVSHLLPADSFDSSTASPVLGKMENDVKASLPHHTTSNGVLTWDFFSCFSLFFLHQAWHS